MKLIDHNKMGSSNLGWLRSLFHFSFAEYYNPENMNFGVLRVINDDLIDPGTGFPKHPHKDMEIISYVIEGELTHEDSMGHKRTLERGMVQYMSAGSGVYHSEYNYGEDVARLLQIWILPSERSLTPSYGDYNFDWSLRENQWLHMVSPVTGSAPVKIHQDANIYSLWLSSDQSIDVPLTEGRQGYLVQIEGSSKISTTDESGLLHTRDAAELSLPTQLHAIENSHFLFIEMARS